MKRVHAALFFLIIVALLADIVYAIETPKVVNASDLLNKIARGEEINCSGAIITGNLDLTDLNLPRDDFGRGVIASKICISNSLINDDVDFGHSRFLSKIDLSGTTFRGNACFSYSHFVGMAYLRNTSFLKNADFTWAEFNSWLDLSKAAFYKDAYFDHAEIYEFCNLSFASFKGYISFKDAVFSSYAFFTGTQFNSAADFYRAEFHRETRFDGARFLGYANFNDSRFMDYAYFLGSEFQGPITLNMTKIPDLMVGWKSIDGHLVYSEAAYQALLQRFWALGNFDEYDDCYYQYRRLKQSYEPIGVPKIIDILAWISCGYGVKPLRILGFGSAIIILFGIIYWRAKLVPMLHKAKPEDSYEHEGSVVSDMEEAMYLSMMIFLIRPPYILRPIGIWRYLIILERISGWLIMALFLVITARMMIR